jgi:HAD superfamily hydrolase (TIGR01484 family)
MNNEKYLVSDLDGTLIPWEGMGKLGSFESLNVLEKKMIEHNVKLIILTGRSMATILDAMKEYPLPQAEMIFSSAGAALYKRAGEEWVQCPDHRSYLESQNPRWDRNEIFSRLSEIKELASQGEIHQSEYKLSCFLKSLDYQPLLDRAQKLLGDLCDTVSLQIYPEPTQGWCYLDMMAIQADKEGALNYLKLRENISSYVFAGDNWNDRTAFLSDHPAILVHNTPHELKEETRLKRPQQYIASEKFAHGVLEGLEKLGWIV